MRYVLDTQTFFTYCPLTENQLLLKVASFICLSPILSYTIVTNRGESNGGKTNDAYKC